MNNANYQNGGDPSFIPDMGIMKSASSIASSAQSSVTNIKVPTINITGNNTVKGKDNNGIRQLGLEIDATGAVTDNHIKAGSQTMCSVGISCETGAKIKKLIKDQVNGAYQQYEANFGSMNMDSIKADPINSANAIASAGNARALAMTREIDVKAYNLVCKINMQVSMLSSAAIEAKPGKIISLDVKNKKLKVQVDGNPKVHEVLFADLCIGSNGQEGIFSKVYGEDEVTAKCDMDRVDEPSGLISMGPSDQVGGKKKKSNGKKSKNEEELSASNDICE